MHARKWKIPIRNALWLEDCYEEGGKIDFELPRHTDLNVTTTLLGRPVAHRLLDELAEAPGDWGTWLQTKLQAFCSVPPALPIPPLQPLTNKRKQPSSEFATTAVTCKRKAWDKDKTAKTPAQTTRQSGTADRVDQMESFKSVSTVYQDDTERIRNVENIVKKGIELPRIRSCERI